MISTKVGTQTFSKSTQRHDFGDDANMHYAPAQPEGPKSEHLDKNMHAGAKLDAQGASSQKSVGDMLNDIANPGGDLNKTKRKAHNTLDKDDFLKLMLTQMKNQDPMNPMQSHEMAAQLAQFTSLEQLYNVNKNLEGLTKAQDPMQKYEALNFLGKTIKADTRQINRAPGDQASELRFNLMGDATKIKLTISDENGTPVKTIDFGNLKMGPNKISWAGTDQDDREVRPGKYLFTVEAEGSNGKKIGVMTETKGVITGVNYSPEGTMLMVGDQKVRLQDVQKIEDDGLREKQAASEKPAAQQLTKEEEKTENKITVKPETKAEQRVSQATMPIEAALGQAFAAPASNAQAQAKNAYRKP